MALKKSIITFTFVIVSLLMMANGAFAQDVGSLVATLERYYRAKDDLASRVLVKRLAKTPLTFKQWFRVRQILQARPSIGYNILYKWERVPYKTQRSGASKNSESKVNNWIALADSEMLSHKFQSAFTRYQKAAAVLKRELLAGASENRLLYLSTIHNMARALYGAGRYNDSLTVYGWMSKDYPGYRQVLFEKMWAAFRGDHADVALGAIASQQSTYFSDYMEPEAYLVQLYIYKKLCRADDQKMVRHQVSQFKARLAGGKYTYADWAKSDVETYGLLRLVQQQVDDTEDGFVSKAQKQAEQRSVDAVLRGRFESEKKRLLTELNQVLAYSYLAVSTNKLRLKDSDIDVRRLRKTDQEYWPVDDAEDWIDEIGSHLFIGKNQCAEK